MSVVAIVPEKHCRREKSHVEKAIILVDNRGILYPFNFAVPMAQLGRSYREIFLDVGYTNSTAPRLTVEHSAAIMITQMNWKGLVIVFLLVHNTPGSQCLLFRPR